jgi:tryptophanyl-tRNA synthetase
MGELGRMTQFKEKSSKNAENINTGLFSYPVLQAADILLYQANLVPVGEDQRQHLELSRDIAGRFNGIYGDVFTIPDAYIPPIGARIMGLQSPTEKMSKSGENVNDCIYLSDSTDVIIKRFKRAVTDSDAQIKMSEEKPGISNLLTIYACVTGKKIDECVAEFDGKGYGDFKKAVGEAVAALIAPYRQKHTQLMSDIQYLDDVAKSGAQKAAEMAAKTLSNVKKSIGFI